MTTRPTVLRIPALSGVHPQFEVLLRYGDFGSWSDVSLMAVPAGKLLELMALGVAPTGVSVTAAMDSLRQTGTCSTEVFRLGGASAQAPDAMSEGSLLMALHNLGLLAIPVVASSPAAAWLVANCSATPAPGTWVVF